MSAAEALRQGADWLAEAGVDHPRRTAALLLAQAMERDRVFLIAHPEAPVEGEIFARFKQSVERRAAREPLQYILGRQEFHGLELAVKPGVLIPRPETELVVEQALARMEAGDRVCDVGTGSGAIAAAIAAARPDVLVCAADISGEALTVARSNVGAHELAVGLCRMDLLAAIRPGSLDMVVSNPPYVAERTRGGLQHELTYEPAVALFGGEDGLDPYRRLLPQAAEALQPGGSVLMEIGYDSLAAVVELLRSGPWSPPEVFEDLAGIPRVVAAKRQPS